MGISIDQWRQRIGTFSQPVRHRTPIPVLKLKAKYLSLGIRIILFLMLVSQGVESNPGPGPGPGRGTSTSERADVDYSGSQGYGMGRGRGADGWNRGGRRGRGNGRGQQQWDVMESARQDRRITRSQSERINQPSITSWLGVSRVDTGSGASNEQSNEQSDLQALDTTSQHDDNSDTDTDIHAGRENRNRAAERMSFSDERGDRVDEFQSSGDVKDLLIDIRREMRYMNRKFDKLEDTMSSLKQDNKTLKKQNKQLTKKVEELTHNMQSVTELATENERKNERLESQSRRENLKFFGLDESRQETWEESENKVRNYLTEGLNLDQNQNQNQNSLLVKRQTDNTTPGGGWGLTGGD